MRIFSFAFFGLFLFFVFLYLSPESVHFLDDGGINFALQHRSAWMNSFFSDYSGLGAPPVTVTISLIAFTLLFFKKQSRLAAQFAVTMIGIAFWSQALKHLFARPRPSEAFRLLNVTGYSFPSGHALDATGLYVCLSLIAFSVYQKRSEKIILSAFCGAVLFLIGLSRIYLGVHYPLDVLAGVSFGLGWAFFIQSQFDGKLETLAPQSLPYRSGDEGARF